MTRIKIIQQPDLDRALKEQDHSKLCFWLPVTRPTNRAPAMLRMLLRGLTTESCSRLEIPDFDLQLSHEPMNGVYNMVPMMAAFGSMTIDCDSTVQVAGMRVRIGDLAALANSIGARPDPGVEVRDMGDCRRLLTVARSPGLHITTSGTDVASSSPVLKELVTSILRL